MSDLDLFMLLDSVLKPPTHAPGVFHAVPIPNFEAHHIGLSNEGRPALLISSTSRSTTRPPSIQLENLFVQHDVKCRVTTEKGATEGTFTVLQFVGGDAMLRNLFLRAAASLVEMIGPAPATEDVDSAIAGLIELFRAVMLPPQKSVQGLWAELMVITLSSRPADLVRAWHTTPTDRYDFNAGQHRIEVKSATGFQRKHRFSLEQLSPPTDVLLLIASVLMDRSGAGASVFDLAERIYQQLPGEQVRVESQLASTLGESLSRAEAIRFDLEAARQSLAFYDAYAVPRIPAKLPMGVSEVSFVSELSGVAPVDLCSWTDGLFAAIRND